MDTLDRIRGSLFLAGMGDALGAQTEQWTIAEIAEAHGGLVTRFGTPPPDTFAGANGGRSAEVTDDASQMYYLARALVAGGGALDRAGWIACLLDWADTCPKAGFMGPSTEGIVKALRRGEDVSRVGVIGRSSRKMTTVGNTNGAAMRVAPCGLVHPGDLEAACEQAFVTCLPSHDTDVAISAACAIAAGCAQAMAGDGLDGVLGACLRGATIGERLGRERARAVAGPQVLARAEMALEIAGRAGGDDLRFLAEIERKVGNSVLAAESVPAAIGVLAYAKGDPLRTIALASSIGNDTDSIAAMAGAIVGAMVGERRLPAALLAEFIEANRADYALDALAEGLAAIAAQPAAEVPR
ncbi:MAG TPA: ADP-ribosylglycohydrolase family protein [Methylibium sp.]|uniref:ADP-ribosylglycohydrolase family protein n=1 Tax=Methylibium sp. TaxID=2067992 RepID=UPI002DBCD952|nr:ADP-ribosylglycohydrolase family protein [Methylibium sp.]HEU4460273.1 ADP-ribosylglycohydrolase family protein [Methylibium sp.]